MSLIILKEGSSVSLQSQTRFVNLLNLSVARPVVIGSREVVKSLEVLNIIAHHLTLGSTHIALALMQHGNSNLVKFIWHILF